MFRRRVVISLFATAIAAVAPSSCSWLHMHPGEYPSAPAARAAVRQQVISRIPTGNLFDTNPAASHEDDLRDGTETARGLIQPHTTSNQGSSYSHLKFLARIRVDRPYHGLAPSRSPADTVWNYWVVVEMQDRTGRSHYVSAFVAPGVPDHVAIRYLSRTDRHGRHASATARWTHSASNPWGTCGNMCCCEDNHCKTPR